MDNVWICVHPFKKTRNNKSLIKYFKIEKYGYEKAKKLAETLQL